MSVCTEIKPYECGSCDKPQLTGIFFVKPINIGPSERIQPLRFETNVSDDVLRVLNRLKQN